MIVFLTLIYVGLLALLIKLNVIKLNLFWKLSPLLWMLLLFIVLFIPMQWGAPQGTVNVFQTVVEIIPNVTGEVVEVPVRGMQRVEQGEVLFRIDPVPFQIRLNQAKAALENARQQVKQLKEAYESAEAIVRKTEQDVDLLKAEKNNAEARVAAAEAALREANARQVTANELVSTLKLNADTAKGIVDRNERLLSSNAVSQTEFDAMVFQYTTLSNQLITAQIDAKVAVETINKSQANLEVTKTNVVAVDIRQQQLINAELPRVQADARRAKLARDNFVDGQHTLIATAQAQLEQAEFDFEQTTIRAPAAGYAAGVTLRPGQRVANLPLRSWMSFVNEESTRIAVGIDQFALRFVKPGQPAEVTFKLYPGRIFNATVDEIATVNEEGQLSPSGILPEAPSANTPSRPFGIILKFEENADIDVSQLQGGAIGTAAIYTESAQFSHVIRKVMIRMESWMNYILP